MSEFTVPADGPAGSRLMHRRLLCAAFVGLYLLYSINFAYFFVDDEVIPFVYAQNLISGRGLVYNPDDGPAEGYSDFLSVGIDAVILEIVKASGGNKLAALVIARLIALASAAAIVVLTFTIVWRRFARNWAAVFGGMTFLALAGPLGVWGWSGLEATLFGLILAALLAMLLDQTEASRWRDRATLALAVLAQLCRIDGAVWVMILVLPFLIWTPAPRRDQLLRRVVLPAAVLFAAYHGWRYWYFGDLLPMPVYAKVLYKLESRRVLISNDPPEPYVIAFLKAYRWVPIAAIALGSGALWRHPLPQMRTLAAATLLGCGYLWLVGDWMFGFRFFVPLLAPLAVLIASAFAELSNRNARVALAAVLLWIPAVAGIGYDFERCYEREEHRPSWWAAPGVDPARTFAPFYDVYLRARPYVVPGEITAYNQAGFVPFMLDSRNIDDLGICTKFYARLPTTDVVFTEVGRYSPLTARPVRRASETYTLSRAPKLLIEPHANLVSANYGSVPRTVLGGSYRLLFETPGAAAYVPSDPLTTERDPGPYLENLVHISHLRRAVENGREIPQPQYKSRLGYVFGERTHIACSDRFTADFSFSETDEDVYELFAAGIRSTARASLDLSLSNSSGRVVYRATYPLQPNEFRELFVRLPQPVRAAGLSIAVTPASPGGQSVSLEDLRVQGQGGRLKKFLAQGRVQGY